MNRLAGRARVEGVPVPLPLWMTLVTSLFWTCFLTVLRLSNWRVDMSTAEDWGGTSYLRGRWLPRAET